ncbi:hypothetical protein Ancab_005868 [Ancistrocladus abbreviatus]
MEENFGLFQFHVPQQSRRDKLRIVNDDLPLPPHFMLNSSSSTTTTTTITTTPSSDVLSLPPSKQIDQNIPPSSSSSSFHNFPRFNSLSSSSSGLNLSLGGGGSSGGVGGHSPTSNAQQKWRGMGAASATPVGPFTGYASILSRSRFLKPAQELLEDFCNGYRGRIADFSESNNNNEPVLEDSSLSAAAWSWNDNCFTDRCANSPLFSMLNEVYRRYRLYCQQMHSAVTSFEAVAGLGNAAPFLCLAIKAVSKHFNCMKNAILDHIHFASKAFRSSENGKGVVPGFCSIDPVHNNRKQLQSSNFLQHPVWRSQRGFPDKAVAVLRTWLFENFLHPYPTDSDKQMLAQRTGLSRNQVSNWFTNARVRLWKPMVEEIHTLEKRAQFSSVDNERFANMLANRYCLNYQPSQGDSQRMCVPKVQEDQSKFGRIRFCQEAEQNGEQLDMPSHNLLSNQVMGIGGSETNRYTGNSTALGSGQDNAVDLSWATHGPGIPFWLAK